MKSQVTLVSSTKIPTSLLFRRLLWALIAFIVLGALIGWIASTVMGRDNGFIMNLVIGIVGSFLGGFVSRLFIGSDSSFLAFSWMGLFWSFIGAIILLAVVGALTGRKHHTA